MIETIIFAAAELSALIAKTTIRMRNRIVDAINDKRYAVLLRGKVLG